MNFKTNYLGVELKNPLIVSASPLTKSVEGVVRCADAGAGAVVLKSLFEEQISADIKPLEEDPTFFSHPEAMEYIENLGMAIQPEGYLSLIEESKKRTDIPIFASLNCVSPEWWTGYAKEIDAAGADGLELNVSLSVIDPRISGNKVESQILKLIDAVRHKVELPIAVKLGREFSDLPYLIKSIRKLKVQGIVLFNRYYRPDIDLESLTLVTGKQYSNPDEFLPVLRWIALLSSNLGMDISASTGVHNSTEVIKAILAGAQTTQLCSGLFRNGMKHIKVILKEMEEWMTKKGFQSLDDFRGMLSNKHTDSTYFERVQYIKALVGTE